MRSEATSDLVDMKCDSLPQVLEWPVPYGLPYVVYCIEWCSTWSSGVLSKEPSQDMHTHAYMHTCTCIHMRTCIHIHTCIHMMNSRFMTEMSYGGIEFDSIICWIWVAWNVQHALKN